MRIRDIIKLGGGKLRYFKESRGPNRKMRREEETKSHYSGIAKATPKNWNRDKHKRRKEEKRRRKQAWR